MTAQLEPFDRNLTLQDRVRLYLNSFGEREIDVTIEKMAKDLQSPQPSVYQVINILRQRNELDVKKEPQPTGPDKIVGIKINKLEPSGRTYKRAAQRSGGVHRIKPAIDSLVPSKDEIFLPKTVEYMKKRLAVEDIRARALSAGLHESVVSFEQDDQAEEAMLLLKHFTDLKKAYEELTEKYTMQTFDLEAERRNVSTLEARLREKTDQMLREFNNA